MPASRCAPGTTPRAVTAGITARVTDAAARLDPCEGLAVDQRQAEGLSLLALVAGQLSLATTKVRGA